MNQVIPKVCPFCQSLVIEKSGVSRKTGKEYHLWGCSNFPTCKYVYHEETPKSGGFQKGIGGDNTEVLKALRVIYIEIDELKKEFKEFTKIFIDKQE